MRKWSDIQNRINNTLDNLNRQLNNEFSTPYPNLINFINAIKNLSCRKLSEIQNIKNHGGRRPKRN